MEREGRLKQFQDEALPHMGALYRSALSLTGTPAEAEDLVQETYREAWNSFHRYRPETNCKAWLFRILFRQRNRWLRRLVRRSEVPLEEVDDKSPSLEPDAFEKLESRELRKLLDSLPEEYRMVLVLTDVEGLRYREVAELMEIPLGTVMSRLNRARALMRSKLRGASSARSA